MAQFDVHACRAYLDRFVADAGATKDPVERVLLEGLAFANLRLADLQSQAAQAKSIEAAKSGPTWPGCGRSLMTWRQPGRR
jgi:hypothetical protein